MAIRVLVACEYSGAVRDAFTALGADAMSCDLLPSETPGNHYQGNVFDVLNNGWDLMIAHPPCTRLTVAANKYYKPEYASRFPTIQQDREEAVLFFMALVNAPIPRIAIENPVGIMSTRYRKPDQIIQPYQFGDTERKATCLWLKGLPQLVHSNIVKPEIIYHESGRTDGKLHFETLKLPKEERAKVRSKTFPGIAHAIASQYMIFFSNQNTYTK